MSSSFKEELFSDDEDKEKFEDAKISELEKTIGVEEEVCPYLYCLLKILLFGSNSPYVVYNSINQSSLFVFIFFLCMKPFRCMVADLPIALC